MDTETLRRLLRFVNANGSVTDTCTALANEAKAEALVEAKARLKEMFVQAILHKVLETPPDPSGIASPPVSPPALEDVTQAPPASLQEASVSAGPTIVPESPAAVAATVESSGSSVPPAETVAADSTAADTSMAEPLATSPASDDTSTAEPDPSVPPAEASVDDQQQLFQEMEAIRRQIAENEARLRNVQAAPSRAEETPEPLAGAIAADDAATAGADDSHPTEEDAAEVGDAYYVYGLLPADIALPTGAETIAGIDPAHAVIGLSYRDIQAAVSRAPLNEFGEEELAERFKDLTWVEDKVRRHQQVLETLMRYGPLVPLRFCTLYRSSERVQTLLADNYAYWVELLRTFRGKQEWGVKAYLVEETLAARVGEVSQQIQQLKEQIAQRSAGAAYFAKKQLEEAVAKEIERLSDEYAQDSHNRLTACAVEARLNSLQSSELSGNDARMLLNGAYLVDEAQWSIYRTELDALEAQYGPLGLTYALTGPWPPYNFIPALEEQDAHEPGCS